VVKAIYFTYDIALLYKIVLLAFVASRVFRAIKHRKLYLWREVLVWGLFLYFAILLYNTFEPFTILLEREDQQANLVPLQGILKMIENASIFEDRVTRTIVFINIVGNILLFSPIGLTIPLLDTRLNRGWLVVLLGLSFSLVIELAQTFLIHRVFDVDDLILNAFGTLLGFLLYAMISAIHPVRAFFERVREAARPNAFRYALAFLVFAAVVTLGIYFYGLDQFRQILQ
jgi:glycopeptide antibiotics resistance protein